MKIPSASLILLTLFSWKKQLYTRLCLSVHPSIRPPVRGSVKRFLKTANSSKLHKIQQLLELQELQLLA